ncbi:MAG: serine/threonine-protein kinase [Acidobacteriota bacterium]
MARDFPKPQDRYPVVYLKDTDLPLPKHVVNNKMRYAYFKTIARGGKCIIQSCKDFHLSRVVAYKSLRPEIADDPFEQQRFLREARVTAMLQHPNTIPIYELSRDTSGHYYFTMKLVEGSTLRELLDARSKDTEDLRLARRVEILAQVGHALDYAHQHGVVHRDVKPENVLVGPFGEVLLLDWGLAKVWSMTEEQVPPMPFEEVEDPSLTARGKLQGTILYMSPEQAAESSDLDHRTDIYSLGAVLYEALSFESMLRGKTTYELLEAVEQGAIESPRERRPDLEIPAVLDRICLRCVANDPADRYQTMAEVVAELQAWRRSITP